MNKIPGTKFHERALPLIVSLLASSLTRKPFQLSMLTQRKQYWFLLVNVITTTPLVVIKTQLLLQIFNGDDLNFFQNG